MLERIEQRLNDVANTTSEVKELDLVEQTQGQVETALEQRPLRTVGIAILIGFTLGLLSRL